MTTTDCQVEGETTTRCGDGVGAKRTASCPQSSLVRTHSVEAEASFEKLPTASTAMCERCYRQKKHYLRTEMQLHTYIIQNPNF